MAIAAIEHIDIDERGIARVAGSKIKVQAIAIDHTFHGRTPVEIQAEYPHLSLAQIHAALAYYYDHRPEIDAQIEESRRLYEQLRSEAGESPVAKRLRAQGLLP